MKKEFLLPEAVFNQHIILLGKTRSGKSSVMRLCAEHLLEQGKPVTVIDPKGDWFGLKLSRDGKRPGFPMVIFGGEHADVPMNPQSGNAIAELLSTGNRSAIVDLGGWTVADRTRFWIDFASTYFRTHKGRHFLFIDEVHNLAPKGKIIDPKASLMLHWSNRLASEGLGKGINLVAASQRPQKVHNDFLTSCETLIAMKVIHKADRDALKDWIDACGDPELGKEVLSTVAANNRGQGWVYSPEANFGPQKVQFPLFETYDSFAPQGAAPAKLTGWADVDLEEVKAKLADVVKEAEAKDPVKLQARIRELEKNMAINGHKAPANENFLKEVKQLRRGIFDLEHFARAAESNLADYRQAISSAIETLGRAVNRGTVAPPDYKSLKEIAHSSGPNFQKNMDENLPPSARAFTPRTRISKVDVANFTGNPLAGPQMKILVALLELESIGVDQAPREQVAAWAGYSPESGGFNNPMGRLNMEGLVTYPRQGYVALTEEGRQAGGGSMPRPDRENVQLRILDHCTGPERKILYALLHHAGQNAMTVGELAEKSGYSVESGGFNNPKGRLRTKGLIEYPSPGLVKPSAWLFFE